MTHKTPVYPIALENTTDPTLSELHALIKPLPCVLHKRTSVDGSGCVIEMKDDISSESKYHHQHQQPQQQQQQHVRSNLSPQASIMLESTVRGKQSDFIGILSPETSRPQKSHPRNLNADSTGAENTYKNNNSYAAMLKTSGPPPSRTTSARLPARNDLVSQGKTWARHTTK